MLPGGTGVRKVSEAQSPTERWQAILSRTEGRIDQAAKAKSADGGATLAHTREGTRSPYILPALALAFNAGLRHAEIRHLTWGQIDFEKQYLTVGKGKTDAGAGRTIPLNGRVGKPEFGTQRPLDPTRPVSTLKTSWKNVKTQVGVTGRFHDTRHTLITEFAESCAGDQTIMDIAGHVSRQMLARYSHIRMEAKRKALDAIDAKQKLVESELTGKAAAKESEVQ